MAAPKVFDYVASSEWIRAQRTCSRWPNRHWQVPHPHRVGDRGNAHRTPKGNFTPSSTSSQPYTEGLADNTVGKIIESLLRVDLIIFDELGFAPLFDTGTQLLFRFVAGAYERRSLAIRSHWPFDQSDRFLSEQTTAVSIPAALPHHAIVAITDGGLLPHKRRQTPEGAQPKPT